jgi:hypothetical protein
MQDVVKGIHAALAKDVFLVTGTKMSIVIHLLGKKIGVCA